VKKKRCLITAAAVLLAVILGFFVYTAVYYHADEAALSALRTDEDAAVTQTDYGYLFDGPGEDAALIFYPGGKVEAEAYAPLLHRLAAGGLDVCLVRMPLRLAVFGQNRADDVMAAYPYAHWYIGGHSLGGSVAALYAADNSEAVEGLVLCAAYPTKPLDDGLIEISLTGSEDGVINRARQESGLVYAPANSSVFVIEGGNHAQFGSYGPQAGDGAAQIPPEQQWDEAAEEILAALGRAA